MLDQGRRDRLATAIAGLKALGPNDPIGLAGLGAVRVALRSEIDEAKDFAASIERTPEELRSLAARANLLGAKARRADLANLRLLAMDGLEEFHEQAAASASDAVAAYLAFKDEHADAMVEEEEAFVGMCDAAQADREHYEAHGSPDE